MLLYQVISHSKGFISDRLLLRRFCAIRVLLILWQKWEACIFIDSENQTVRMLYLIAYPYMVMKAIYAILASLAHEL